MQFEDGGRRFVIASNGGDPAHPAWFKNLQTKPEVGVADSAASATRRAPRSSAATSAARLWKKVTTEAPNFAAYEKKTGGREIPVVELKRV